MQFFYDAQVKRYLTQFMRIMSNFSYQDAKGNITQVPVVYGDMNRQVAQILKKNSENVMPTAPFISCYIKALDFDRTRLQDPTFVNSYKVLERATDVNGNYINVQGANYTVETIMPSPHLATFAADIWTSNTDQKLQIWEQIAVLFNPSLELQVSTNAIDWTSLSVLTLDSQIWSNRSIPQGVDVNIDILNMVFKTPIWITPPAKVKQLGVITNIISSMYAVNQGDVASQYSDPFAADIFSNIIPDAKTIITPGEYDILVMNNVATLINVNNQQDNIDTNNPQNIDSWYKILDLYPGVFTAGLSQLRLSQPSGMEIIAYVSVNPLDDSQLSLVIDRDTVPTNTILSNGRGTVDAIINPQTYSPQNITVGTTYLILEDLNPGWAISNFDGPISWKNSDGSDPHAAANDIIQWDGANWNIVFDSTVYQPITYITNTYTGIQYMWDYNNLQWSKAYEGVYPAGSWRLIL